MQDCAKNRDSPISVKKVVSILPNDYSRLENKPAINGVELTKDTTLEELSILSSNVAEYPTLTFEEAAASNMSVLSISEDGELASVPLEDILSEVKSTVSTVDALDESMEVGAYVFLKI